MEPVPAGPHQGALKQRGESGQKCKSGKSGKHRSRIGESKRKREELERPRQELAERKSSTVDSKTSTEEQAEHQRLRNEVAEYKSRADLSNAEVQRLQKELAANRKDVQDARAKADVARKKAADAEADVLYEQRCVSLFAEDKPCAYREMKRLIDCCNIHRGCKSKKSNFHDGVLCVR